MKKNTNNQFNKTVLKNGLTLLTENLIGFRSLALGIWVKIGTRHESDSIAGVSHFLEHMLFKGTKKRSALQIAQEVDRVGGEFNAFTTRELTCFHILLLNRDYKLGIDILSDILLNSNFKLDEFEKERRVILQEIAMVEESPEELVHDLFFEMIYKNHGLGKPILGTQKSINSMSRENLVKFFSHHYRPEQIIISIAGEISHEELKQKVNQRFGGSWPQRKIQTSAHFELTHQPAPELNYGRWWIEKPTEQVHLVWGVKGVNYTSKDRFAAFLLNLFLGGGMSSSLFQEIREKNALAYTVYSSLSSFVDSGVFSIYVATGMGQIPLCLKLIEKCVNRMKKNCLSKKELQFIKDNFKGTVLLSSDSVESRMSSIAKNQLYLNKYVSVTDVCRQIDAVSSSEIRGVANLLFEHDHRSMMALGPKPTKTVLKALRPELIQHKL